MVEARFVNKPFGGWVESVFTWATQRFFFQRAALPFVRCCASPCLRAIRLTMYSRGDDVARPHDPDDMHD